MRASFEVITYYMARRVLGLLARLIDRHHPHRSQGDAGPPITPAPEHSLTDTKRGPRRAEQETP